MDQSEYWRFCETVASKTLSTFLFHFCYFPETGVKYFWSYVAALVLYWGCLYLESYVEKKKR